MKQSKSTRKKMQTLILNFQISHTIKQTQTAKSQNTTFCQKTQGKLFIQNYQEMNKIQKAGKLFTLLNLLMETKSKRIGSTLVLRT